MRLGNKTEVDGLPKPEGQAETDEKKSDREKKKAPDFLCGNAPETHFVSAFWLDSPL